jgi:hypothetical protein
MANGGSDVCRTCCYLVKCSDSVGICNLRIFTVSDIHSVRCVNHFPCHSPSKDLTTPVGPVFMPDPDDYSALVERWDLGEVKPDFEVLIDVLNQMPEIPRREYWSGLWFDHVLIRHVQRLRLKQAVQGLQRIISFNPLAKEKTTLPWPRNRIETVGLAIEAMASIDPQKAFTAVLSGLHTGYDGILRRQPKHGLRRDLYAPIRYHSVRSLVHYPDRISMVFLSGAAHDPHPDVSRLALRILTMGAT